jgi:hypothetical protein
MAPKFICKSKIYCGQKKLSWLGVQRLSIAEFMAEIP